MSRARILLVEDEPSLTLTLGDRLRAEGYEVATERDGARGEERARAGNVDLVVLDLNLPTKNGLDICRDLRRDGVTTPILMLTARADVVDRIVGLKLGADDYLPKPFDTLELLARIEALLRRAPDSFTGGERVRFGDLRIDFAGAEVVRGEEPIDLSTLELRLLRYFVEHPGKVLSRDELLDKVWGYDATPVTRTVDVHVASLRQKIESVPSKPRHLLTVHGRGYKFVLG
ncbi:MAG: response regulator transcription factor [Acidobacteriota bacterium]